MSSFSQACFNQAWNSDYSEIPTTPYVVSSSVYYIVSEDFNNDGHKDLVYANTSQNTISVKLGDGNASFTAPITFNAGTTPWEVACADFNNDGNMDIVCANLGSNNISYIKGNGNGTFLAAVSYAVGTGPQHLCIADFNMDGNLDIATSNINSNNVSIITGNGLGVFSAATNIGVGTTPRGIATGDLNADGSPDIVVANSGSGNLSILTNNGSGSFAVSSVNVSGTDPEDVVCGNFYPGAPDDIMCVCPGSNEVNLIINIGGGMFFINQIIPVVDTPLYIESENFNGDGFADLVVSNTVSGNVTILSGSSSGTFSNSGSYGIGAALQGIACQDYNEDGNIDLAVVNNNGFRRIAIQLGHGDGSFGYNFFTGNAPRFIGTSDLNGDGREDMLSSNNTPRTLSVFLSKTNGDYFPAVDYPVGSSSPYNFCANDFNNDGKEDVAIAVNANVAVLLGGTAGTLNAFTNFAAGLNARAVLSYDYNGDGNIDLAVSNYGTTGKVNILLGNGNGTFNAAVQYSAGTNPSEMVQADFNNDGNIDIAVANYTLTNCVSILTGNGNGTFNAPVFVSALETAARINCIAHADFNHDGKEDLVVPIGNGPGMEVWFGDGTLGFNKFQFSVGALNDRSGSVCVSDINNDGFMDIEVINTTAGSIAVLKNNTSGGFDSPVSIPLDNSITGICSADFNLDGKMDLLLGSSGNSNISMMLNSPTVSVTGNQVSCAGSNNLLTASGGLTYSWSSNAGSATTNTVVVAPIINSTYTVTGTNSSGCSDTATFSILVNPLPNVTINSSASTVCATTTVLLYGQGADTYTWNNGVVDSIPFTLSGSNNYILTGVDTNGCIDTAQVFLSPPPLQNPEICSVTVDDFGNNNLIYWDKTLYQMADTFLVYRDTSNNAYGLIGKVPYDSLSQFVDTLRNLYGVNGGDPKVSSWRYKLAFVDTCGIMSNYSPYHQTLFIQNVGANFSWNHYEIEGQATPVPALQNYLFMRDDIANGNYILNQTLSASSLAYTDPTYASVATTADWRVETLWSISCTPTLRLTGNNDLQTTIVRSKSNIKNTRTVGIKSDLSTNSGLKVYPNPANDAVSVEVPVPMAIEIKGEATIIIENMLGQVVYTIQTNKLMNSINTSNLNNGVYLVKIKSGNQYLSQKLIIGK